MSRHHQSGQSHAGPPWGLRSAFPPPPMANLAGELRGFSTCRDTRAALLAYGLPEKTTYQRGHGAEDLEPCLASYRGRPGWLVLAQDLRALGGTKRIISEQTDALEKAKIRILDITHPEDRTYAALIQRASVLISGSRFTDRRRARRQGRVGGLAKGRAAADGRDGLAQRWLVDRIVDHRDIPWEMKLEASFPALFRKHSASPLRRQRASEKGLTDALSPARPPPTQRAAGF